MRSFSCLLVILAFAALSTPLIAGEPVARPSLTNDASAVVEQFHAALKRGDAVEATALLADTVVIYEEGEAELSKAQYASSHLQADIAFMAGMTETTIDRRSGASNDLAWVITQGRTKGLYHERIIDSETTETMILQRFADGWKIVHVHWSSKRAAPR